MRRICRPCYRTQHCYDMLLSPTFHPLPVPCRIPSLCFTVLYRQSFISCSNYGDFCYSSPTPSHLTPACCLPIYQHLILLTSVIYSLVDIYSPNAIIFSTIVFHLFSYHCSLSLLFRAFMSTITHALSGIISSISYLSYFTPHYPFF